MLISLMSFFIFELLKSTYSTYSADIPCIFNEISREQHINMWGNWEHYSDYNVIPLYSGTYLYFIFFPLL